MPGSMGKFCTSNTSCVSQWSAQLVMCTKRGSRAAIARCAVVLNVNRAVWYSLSISTTFIARVAPTSWQNELIISFVYPRRRSPEIVGIRGSFHPLRNFLLTNFKRRRLESTVYCKLRRLISYTFGRNKSRA